MPIRDLTPEEWKAEGVELFGEDMIKWKFVCPACGNIASASDFRQYKGAGATPNSVTCECIGRYTGAKTMGGDGKTKPCNYAGYGLFRFSPLHVHQNDGHVTHCFDFARDAEPEPAEDPTDYDLLAKDLPASMLPESEQPL